MSTMVEKLLNEIKERLDILISLRVPLFDKNKYNLKDGTQLSVLKLCDMQHTQKDISSKLKKNKKAVSRAIEKLKKKGLVTSIKFAGKTVYLRIV